MRPAVVQHSNRDRGSEAKREGSDDVFRRNPPPQKSRFRRLRFKNRTFQPRRFAEVGRFRRGQFSERQSFRVSEFVSMGSYSSPSTLAVDAAVELLRDSIAKGKIKVDPGKDVPRTRGGTVDYSDQFEKEKKECLEILNRLVTVIELLRNEKEKTM